jgi:hypothetical protein
VQRETGTIFLPMRRRLPAAAIRGCAPPWHPWTRGAIARAERTADGRVHLAVLRRRPGGVLLSLTGVGAAQAESLAPVAARIRRALASGAGLRGTSAFEDAVTSLVVDTGPRNAVLRLGRRCPIAPALRTMPDPASIIASKTTLARALGSPVLARRLQALARAFAVVAPCSPSRS